jgi:hypothetical protein
MIPAGPPHPIAGPRRLCCVRWVRPMQLTVNRLRASVDLPDAGYRRLPIAGSVCPPAEIGRLELACPGCLKTGFSHGFSARRLMRWLVWTDLPEVTARTGLDGAGASKGTFLRCCAGCNRCSVSCYSHPVSKACLNQRRSACRAGTESARRTQESRLHGQWHPEFPNPCWQGPRHAAFAPKQGNSGWTAETGKAILDPGRPARHPSLLGDQNFY